MRLFFLSAAALLFAGVAARADTLTYDVSADGVSYNVNRGENLIASQSFAQFDPSLGTLNSIRIGVSGTATTSAIFARFVDVLAGSDNRIILNGGRNESGSYGKPFAISTIATFQAFPVFLGVFEGAGTQNLLLDFDGPTATSNTDISVSYNYTPAVVTPPPAVAPEPSSIALLGTGLLGVAGVVKRRLA